MSLPKRLSALCLCLCLALGLSGCTPAVFGRWVLERSLRALSGAESQSEPAQAEGELAGREPYVDVASATSATVMVYLCGSDLESRFGCASADLDEMLLAGLSERIHVVVETGGASTWHNGLIEREDNQRYCLREGKLVSLEQELGSRDMTKPETLRDFVRFCAEEYPADRYILLLWDHGGGALGGFGYDERYPDSPAMDLAQLDQALEEAGVRFDIVGFDACLMATLETAFVLERHADHMLASQMEEPGCGWYYTNWLTALSLNPAITSRTLGELVVDDFVDRVQAREGEQGTLSLVNLTRLSGVLEALSGFVGGAREALSDQQFAKIAQARAKSSQTKRFEGEYDHVDLHLLAENLSQIPGAQALIQAVDAVVLYQRSTQTTRDWNGLSIYFPYAGPQEFPGMVELYGKIGFAKDYVGFLSAYMTIVAGGQAQQEYRLDDWFDEELFDEYLPYYQETAYAKEELELVEKEGYYALSLSDEDWDITTTIQVQVLFDDGEGYVDLGSDNLYELDPDGDLVVSFDNTWLCLDGEVVCFYFEEEDYASEQWYTYGYVPALVNGEEAELIVRWDWTNEHGYVAGYRPVYDGILAQRGLFQLEVGDAIEYLCEAYDYQLNPTGSFLWGEKTAFDGELTVSYEDIGLGECLVYYCLTDIYGNQVWTEPVIFTD